MEVKINLGRSISKGLIVNMHIALNYADVRSKVFSEGLQQGSVRLGVIKLSTISET